MEKNLKYIKNCKGAFSPKLQKPQVNENVLNYKCEGYKLV